MLILGFHCFSGAHDTSACIVRDGRIIAAAEEERFSRLKHDGSFPNLAIDYCLSEAGVRMSDVDFIAFPDTPFRTGPHSAHAEGDEMFFRRMLQEGLIRKRSLLHKRALDFWQSSGLPTADVGLSRHVHDGLASLARRHGTLPPVRYFDHHRAHAAAAFLTSGLDSAAVVTVDGRGGNYASVIWRGRGTTLERCSGEPYTNSVGLFYELCTEYLGLGALEAGKTMGLAPYGNSALGRDRVARIFQTEGDRAYRFIEPPTEPVLGIAKRRSGMPILEGEYPHFAAAVQAAAERAIARTVDNALEVTGETALCLGGGVTYNCTSNGALLASNPARPIWVFPASGDSGLSVGAALLCAADLGELDRSRLQNAYLGPGFSEAECAAAIDAERGVQSVRPENLCSTVAERVSEGQIIGWFNGRLELGPRALGNRSILADPRSVEIRDRVNRVKGREMWRPLAPVVKSERAAEFFHLDVPSPFMLFAVQVRQEKKAVVPGVVHVDGSARPQTVTHEQNPRLYELLSAFESIAGVPVLLNTSFNDASEPIVCSPHDALKTFVGTELDALVLGPFLVTRRD